MKSNRLFLTTFTAFFLLLNHRIIAQIDTAVRYRQVPEDHRSRIITDQKNHIKYVLDKSHIYIEALAQNESRMWRTDPWMDYKWAVHPTERPIVIAFILTNDSSTHFRDVLAVRYDNLGFAAIDAKTGKIINIGED